MIPQFGGLEVTTSSTALQALTDAVLYLTDYPFECAEQLAVAAARDRGAARRARRVRRAEGCPARRRSTPRSRATSTDLAALQNDDGGFGRSGGAAASRGRSARSRRPTRCIAPQAKGFDVPGASIARGLDVPHATSSSRSRRSTSEQARCDAACLRALRAALAGRRDPAQARALVRRGAATSCRSRRSAGCGRSSTTPACRRGDRRAASPTAPSRPPAPPTSPTDYGDGAYLLLHSDRRADGIVLEALIARATRRATSSRRSSRACWRTRPQGPLGQHAGERLRPARAATATSTPTRTTTPDFVARVWLGDRYAGEHASRGARPTANTIDIPTARAGRRRRRRTSPLGRRRAPAGCTTGIGLRYAPAILDLAPARSRLRRGRARTRRSTTRPT